MGDAAVIARRRQATKQSRRGHDPWARDCFAALAMTGFLFRGRSGLAVLVGVDLGTLIEKGLGLLLHAGPRVVAYLLGDLHRAEFGTAHRAALRELGAFGGQGLVVELLGRLGIERQVELV